MILWASSWGWMVLDGFTPVSGAQAGIAKASLQLLSSLLQVNPGVGVVVVVAEELLTTREGKQNAQALSSLFCHVCWYPTGQSKSHGQVQIQGWRSRLYLLVGGANNTDHFSICHTLFNDYRREFMYFI